MRIVVDASVLFSPARLLSSRVRHWSTAIKETGNNFCRDNVFPSDKTFRDIGHLIGSEELSNMYLVIDRHKFYIQVNDM